MCRPPPMQPAARVGGHRSRLQFQQWAIQFQKCPALLPPSPLGLYVGRAKCAAVDVPCSTVSSLTTPSSGEEAQAERSHATTNTRIPHHAEHLFTMLNLLIAESGATSGTGGLMPKKSGHEKILRGKRS